jgi:UDP-N-acetylenolpyruvoylglucosamine reductase
MALSDSTYQTLCALGGVSVWRDASLAPLTTIGTGGKAAALAIVADTQAAVSTLKLLEEQGLPWVCLGAGSNFLVADGGFPGVVVRLGPDFERIQGLPSCSVEGSEPVIVTVGAAASLPRLAAASARVGLAGLDFACGIPGTVGGAVAMNAGAYDRSVVDVLQEIQIATASGDRWLSARDLDYGYRFCSLPPASIVTAARFRLVPGEAEVVLECHRAILRKRLSVQPHGVRTFGSTFKNPSGGAAGRLLEAAGLKGVRRGGAEISRVHANFLVNLEGATTADVLALMSLMREEVKSSCGVVLEPEVRLIGCQFPWESAAADSQGSPDPNE